MIDKESFEEWLAHPVTEHVLKYAGGLAEENRLKWIAVSWGGGQCDERVLIDLKARYEANKDLNELKYEDIEDVVEANPERSELGV